MHSDVDIRQLAVDVHQFPPMADDFFQDMHDQGYVVFHKAVATAWSFHS